MNFGLEGASSNRPKPALSISSVSLKMISESTLEIIFFYNTFVFIHAKQVFYMQCKNKT